MASTALQIEAARAASLAVHAAAGMAAAAGSRAAARCLRAAEGLVRASVALLQAPAAEPQPRADAAPGASLGASAGASRRRRRGRGADRAAEAVAGQAGSSGNASRKVLQGAELHPPVPLAGGGALVLQGELAPVLPHPVFVAAGGGAALRAAGPAQQEVQLAASRLAVAEALEEPEAMEVSDGAAPTSSPAGSSARPRPDFIDPRGRLCTCGHPCCLSRKRRCGGCGWTYTVEQLSGLRELRTDPAFCERVERSLAKARARLAAADSIDEF